MRQPIIMSLSSLGLSKRLLNASFETDLGGWQVTGPPEGSGANANNFIQTDASGFPVGNTIATPRSLLVGLPLSRAVSQSATSVGGKGPRLAAGTLPTE